MQIWLHKYSWGQERLSSCQDGSGFKHIVFLFKELQVVSICLFNIKLFVCMGCEGVQMEQIHSYCCWLVVRSRMMVGGIFAQVLKL
jgi:hypothetical protein